MSRAVVAPRALSNLERKSGSLNLIFMLTGGVGVRVSGGAFLADSSQNVGSRLSCWISWSWDSGSTISIEYVEGLWVSHPLWAPMFTMWSLR